MREKMELGTLVDWKELKNLSRKACWDLRDVLAIFIRDYLYKFIEENTHSYPANYGSIGEWHEKIRDVAENFSFGIADLLDYNSSILNSPEFTKNQKIEKLQEVDELRQKCINDAFDGLKEIFWDLWD